MKISIRTHLDYRFARPTDVLLQCEAAAMPGQAIEGATLHIAPGVRPTHIAAQDGIGERCWVRVDGHLTVDYVATASIDRAVTDCLALPGTPLHQLPADTVQYLMGSRYCPSDGFDRFVEAEFAGLEGGRQVIAMRDWIHARFRYAPGVSASETTAADSFIRRQGVCRDYAHVLIALARAAGIPARIASVYAPGVEPPDFHAVAQVFLDGDWHLVDATRMAEPGAMAIIGVGRDAADVAFLTSFGDAEFVAQSVAVAAID